MTSAFFAISVLNKSKIPIDQLKIVLSFLNQKALDEYLIISEIHTDKKKLGKNESTNLIINYEIDKNKNNEFSINDANKILNIN